MSMPSTPEIVLGGLLILYILVGAIRGGEKGFGRTLHRSIAAVLSLIFTAFFVLFIFEGLPEWALSQFRDQILNAVPADYQAVLTDEQLRDVVQIFLSMFLAPLMFFFLFSIIRGLIRILTFFLSRKKKSGFSFMGFLLGAVLGAFVFCVAYTPIIGFIESADIVLSAISTSDQEAIDQDTKDTLRSLNENVFHPIAQSPYVAIVMDNGGDRLFEHLTTVEVTDDLKTNLKAELTAFESLYEDAVAISKLDLANCTKEDTEVLDAAVKHLDGSPLLKHTASLILSKVCTAWSENQPFLGIAAPLTQETTQMESIQNDLLSTIFKIFATSDVNTITPDIQTLVNMVDIAYDNQMFQSMDSADKMIDCLAKEGFVSALVAELGTNNHMKLLIPELTNISIRLVASALEIPSDYEEVYNKLMGTAANEYNAVMALPEEERVDALAEKINKAFTDNGIDASASVAYLVSDAMLKDFSDLSEITAADVSAFFAAYAAANAEEITPEPEQGETAFANGLFENLAQTDTTPAREFSAAKTAGKTTVAITKITQDREATESELQQIITQFYSETLSVEITTLLVKEAQEGNFSGGTADTLSSAEAIQSSVVVLKDLLVDAEAAAEKITSGTAAAEGKQIETAVSAMKSVYTAVAASDGKLSASHVADTIRSLGTALDALSSTESIGSTNTANLLTAILQSDKICEATGLDKTTTSSVAQTIVNNAASGESSYTEIMNTVGDAAHVVLISQDENTTSEEKLESFQTMILNLTAASVNTVYDLIDSNLLTNFGLTEERKDLASTAIHKVLDKLVLIRSEVSEEEYKEEAGAVNTLVSLVVDSDRNGLTELFALDDNNQLVNSSAEDTVLTLLSSRVCMETIEEMTHTETGEEVTDPFGIASLMSEAAQQKVTDVCNAYYEDNLPTDAAEQAAFCEKLNAICVALCVSTRYTPAQ